MNTTILTYWFITHKNDWFSKNGGKKQSFMDADITHKFGDLLEETEDYLRKNEITDINSQTLTYTPHGVLALIVLLDQMSRHIHRGNQDKIASNDVYALSFSKMLFKKNWDELLTDSQFMIACMPMRHYANPHTNHILSTKLDYLRCIKQLIEKRTSTLQDHGNLLKQFWKVTHEKQTELFQLFPRYFTSCKDSFVDILDKNALYSGVPSSNLNVHIEPIVKTVKKIVKQYETDSNTNTHYISLSGGVDSMVLAYILNNIDEGKVVAIHIDYGNRLESSAEATYVERWCGIQNPPIIFRSTRIHHTLRRGITDRNVYEEKTKQIRFEAYTKAIKEYSNGNGHMNLGHNYDDIQENVLSNIAKRGSILELSGMDVSNRINDVCILRPLLSIRKKDIFTFAHKYHIPYMKDTTPRYCIRGMIRHEVKPLLQKVYGDGVLDSFNLIANQSDEICKLSNTHMFREFMRRVQRSEVGAWVNYDGYEYHSIFFWKEVIARICHSIGCGSIRLNIIKHKLIPNLTSSKIIWNTGPTVNVCISNKSIYIIPSLKRQWRSSTFKISKRVSKRYSRKISFDDIMAGDIFYCIPCFTHEGKLIHTEYSGKKGTTPWAFRGNGLDTRMKSLLPILCIDTSDYSKDEIVNNDAYHILVKMQLIN